MKLSQFVELESVWILRGSKKFETPVKGWKEGGQVPFSSKNGHCLTFLFWMIEFWKFYHRCYSLRQSFFVPDVFIPCVLFFGKILPKMLIFDVFKAQTSPWSLNWNSTYISVLKSPNCLLCNAENPRFVACFWTEWQGHLWDEFFIFSQLWTIPKRNNENVRISQIVELDKHI